MNTIEIVQTRLQERFPNAEVRLTKPASTDGHWILDIEHQSQSFMLDWLPPDTLSISSLDDSVIGYGEGPDEVYYSLEEALQRLVQLLTSNVADSAVSLDCVAKTAVQGSGSTDC